MSKNLLVDSRVIMQILMMMASMNVMTRQLEKVDAMKLGSNLVSTLAYFPLRPRVRQTSKM
jgi:hypothetical protein